MSRLYQFSCMFLEAKYIFSTSLSTSMAWAKVTSCWDSEKVDNENFHLRSLQIHEGRSDVGKQKVKKKQKEKTNVQINIDAKMKTELELELYDF